MNEKLDRAKISTSKYKHKSLLKTLGTHRQIKIHTSESLCPSPRSTALRAILQQYFNQNECDVLTEMSTRTYLSEYAYLLKCLRVLIIVSACTYDNEYDVLTTAIRL